MSLSGGAENDRRGLRDLWSASSSFWLWIRSFSALRISSFGPPPPPPPPPWMWSFEEGEPRDCLCMLCTLHLSRVQPRCEREREGQCLWVLLAVLSFNRKQTKI